MNIEEFVNKITQGHTLQVLKTMPSDSVDMVLTSPPYYGLRQYNTEKQVWGGDEKCEHDFQMKTYKNPKTPGSWENAAVGNNKAGLICFDITEGMCSKCGCWLGELGQEPIMELYIDHLVEIFDEVKRVIKPSGSLYVNLGDVYSGGTMMGMCERLSQGKDNKMANVQRPNMKVKNLPDKTLCLIPERFAIKMVDHGWRLRNKIIWEKPNSMPTSVRDRLNTTHEYIYFFVKSRRYFFDLDAIRERCKTEGNDQSLAVNSADDQQLPLLDLSDMKPKEVEQDVKLSPKYEKESTGHSNRQGLNRELDEVTLKAYKEYQQPMARYLKRYIKNEHKVILDNVFGQHKWGHWVRTDLSGASLPGVDDWFKLKEILGFDNTFDDKIYEVQKLNIPVFSSGRNPGDFIGVSDIFEICTQPYAESHFAVFPEELCIRPILASCPEFVCKKCGTPRQRIVESNNPSKSFMEKDERTEACIGFGETQSIKSLHRNASPDGKTKGVYYSGKTVGWSACECSAEFEGGIVMDIFAGAGTALLVANKLGRRYVGIELNPKYVSMAEKRILHEGSSLLTIATSDGSPTTQESDASTSENKNLENKKST